MVDKPVLSQEIYWVCTNCNFKILDCEMHSNRTDDVYDYYTCPVCGIESIIPREYW